MTTANRRGRATGLRASKALDRTLSSGRALTGLEANTLAAATPVTLIVLAGPEASGKTTLVSSIYELFQRGPIGGVAFRRSETILGFEERCFDSRATSERSTPDTKRTSVAAPDRYLHLGTTVKASGSEYDLLIADLAGEMFSRARDSLDELRNLTMLQRADRIGVILDGAKLSALDSRQAVVADARQLIRAIAQAESLRSGGSIDIILTKVDLLSQGDGFVVSALGALVESATSLGYRSGSYMTAAGPKTPKIPFGFGVEELFTGWQGSPLGASTSLEVEGANPHRSFLAFQ